MTTDRLVPEDIASQYEIHEWRSAFEQGSRLQPRAGALRVVLGAYLMLVGGLLASSLSEDPEESTTRARLVMQFLACRDDVDGVTGAPVRRLALRRFRHAERHPGARLGFGPFQLGRQRIDRCEIGDRGGAYALTPSARDQPAARGRRSRYGVLA